MATNRDVKMTLSVDTLGEDGIKSLQKSIQSLAAEGGDAAPEFQKLADEVGRLGEQSKALTAFKDLGAATEVLTTKQAEATKTSADLSAKLDTLKTATQEAKVKQQEAAAALAAGQVATLEAAGALQKLKVDYDNAGKQTEAYRTKQKELIDAQTAAKVALVELRTAQREANAELATAEAAQKKAEGAYTRSEKAVKATSAALAAQESVVKEAAAATEKLGLSATDVATSEGVLLAALNKVGSEAAQHSAAIKEMAESDRLLAIQEKGLAELFARGADALQAETLAQRDADRSNAEYAVSLAKVNAEKAKIVSDAAQWQREAEAIVNAAEAAQKLERDTIDLLNAERQLAANNAFEQQANDAAKLVKAADYVQFWITALDQAAAAEKQLAAGESAAKWQREAEAIVNAAEAAQKLERDTIDLLNAERQLAANNAFEQQANDAAKLVKAADYVQFWITALDQAAAAEKQLAAGESAAKWQREAEAIVNAAEAAQKLERDTIDLLNAERQLAANNAFEQQANDAKKLLQAADYVQFWTTELDRADAAAKQLQGAFNALNVRSAEAIRADITAVRSALETVKAQATSTGQSLTGAFTAGEAKIRALEREMRQLNGTMTTGDKAAKIFSNSLGQISVANIVADGVGYLVNKVKELGRAFIDAVVQGDQMRRGLNAVYKDTELTAKQIDFLRKTASESGVSLGALSGEFVRFSASMKSVNVPMAESNALFRAVTAASASLGLEAEATSGALNALGQMASKGTVSMEELRQQLGDRLPGALGLAAKGMGITEAQLIALVSSGGLATRDFIVPFTRALETMRGEVDGLTPAWGRFGTALTTIAQNAGDAGWVQILTVALKGLAAVVGVVGLTVYQVTEGLIFLSKAMAATSARIMGDKQAFTRLAEEADKAANRINASNAALVAVIDPSKAAAAATTAHAATLTANTAEITKSIAANTALSAEQKLTALSTALAGDKTLDASAKMVQYNVAAAELIAKQTLQTESYAKLAKAAKEEGDTLVAMAKLTGDVNAIQTAGVQAAGLHAAALEKLAVSQAAEVSMLTAQKAELIANAKQRGLTDLEIKVQVDAIDALIKKSEAETAQSVQASAAAKQQVLERALLSQATIDHSGAVDTLRQSVDDAAATLQSYEFFAKGGLFTEEQVKVKRQELTVVTALYRDALNDVITKSKLVEASAQADIATTKSVISNKITHNDLLIKEATLRGDLVTVEKLGLAGKQLVIDQMKLEIASRTSANNAILAQNEANRKLVDGSTDLGKQQLKELDTSDQLTRAKQAMNLASGDVVKGLEKELAASKNAADGMMSLVDAYKQLGVQSPQELAKVAAANADAWNTIKTDANASVATLKSAFQTYADSAIAAVGGVGSAQLAATQETLKLEAAAKGLSVTFDETGKAIVGAMVSGGKAITAATGYMDAFAQSTSEATAELVKQQEAEEAALEVREKALDLKEREKAVSAAERGVDAEGFVIDPDTGKRSESLVLNAVAATEVGMNAGLTEDEAYDLYKRLEGSHAITPSGMGMYDWGNFYTGLNEYKEEKLRLNDASRESATSATPPPTSAQTTPSTPASNKTVTIVINGQSQSVNVASDADANALTSILRTLETAANTAS